MSASRWLHAGDEHARGLAAHPVLQRRARVHRHDGPAELRDEALRERVVNLLRLGLAAVGELRRVEVRERLRRAHRADDAARALPVRVWNRDVSAEADDGHLLHRLDVRPDELRAKRAGTHRTQRKRSQQSGHGGGISGERERAIDGPRARVFKLVLVSDTALWRGAAGSVRAR
jgi:hypothetical protein